MYGSFQSDPLNMQRNRAYDVPGIQVKSGWNALAFKTNEELFKSSSKLRSSYGLKNSQRKMKNFLPLIFLLVFAGASAQVRDTLKLTITKVEKKPADTVYYYSSRVDTIALQPVKTDTSKIVKDKNTQDLNTSKYRIRLMGSIRANAFYDFAGMTSSEGFLPYDIPVGEEKIKDLSSVYIGARQSRLGIEGEGNTKVGKVRTYMEVDFASTTSSFWRLRHAYAEWNYFKIGYTWSTFMDNASLPTTVDFEGPNSSLSKRHGLIRYERKYGESSIWGISLEAPQTDYYNPGDSALVNKNLQSNFDFAARYKYSRKWGHVQVAGIFRRINYLNQNQLDVLYGSGVLLSTVVNIDKKSIIYSQYSFGESIANYYVGFANRQLDAVYDPGTGRMTKKFIRGGFLTFTHIVNPLWRLSATVGTSNIKGKDFEAPDTFKSSKYLAANIFYYPIETINIGFELTSGSRTNLDGQRGKATRISMLGSFSF